MLIIANTLFVYIKLKVKLATRVSVRGVLAAVELYWARIFFFFFLLKIWEIQLTYDRTSLKYKLVHVGQVRR